MPSRRTLLRSIAAGAGVAALGVAGTQAFGETVSGGAAAAAPSPRKVDINSGSSGSNVTALQYLLTAYGYKTTADGDYGPLTEKSVAKFQGARGLVKDGWAGPLTMKKMLDSGKVAAKRGWDNRSTVRAAQTLLVKLGYEMAVDGDFGPLTKESVEKYQAKRKLTESGTVDYTTWTYMFSPPRKPGTGFQKGKAVLVAQSGSGLSTWAYDCGPAAFVALQLRMGRTPGKWTDVAHRGDAINYARRTVLGMTNNTRGTGQIRDEVGVVAGFKRLGVDQARTGGFDGALSAVRSGGVSMLGGDLAVCARWNGRSTGSTLHWIALLDYSSKSGKYQVADSSSKHNKLVWVTRGQLASFASSWGASVCIK
ncbi:peptidoglycan-binding domain-containing protein [Streptomyces cavernicola]|uniref:Peptidoglycan-binding domain-containing protein n=1 Tax=Streptomyces cavernicola TaxID=3043613 RepID=A0ABT6SB25_9ACTN|nr:peptidoglycan-binding protein [Streptomyces sp. B-S-A6]MDI3405074.1 peptidoglycan-binding domain-containing protein [Streptomyces sp. B-S-A6]